MGNISRTLKFIAITCMLMLSGCGAARSLIGTATGTVATLWPDVPAFAAATKADLGLPVPVQLLLQSATGGRFDVIAFTTPRPAPSCDRFGASRGAANRCSPRKTAFPAGVTVR